MTTVREYKQSLPETQVTLHISDGLDHGQAFDQSDRVPIFFSSLLPLWHG
jgi:hypothetical protein